jgi:hypothetical protein
MFQVMNFSVSPKALRVSLPVHLVLATASLFSLGAYAQAQTQAQAPTQSTSQQGTSQPSSSQQGTPAPGTAPLAAPGTVAVHGPGVQALAANAVTKYDNRYEVYGGLSYANGQAGQNLPKHYNMGGVEVMGTYWLGPFLRVPNNRLGLVADYRFGAGTSPVLPQAAQFGLNRILIYQDILSGGAQYRFIKNRYAAIDFHALAGATHGTFDTAITGYPSNTIQQPNTTFVGVYSNRTSPWGAAGGSIDFNYSPKVAVRLQPDIVFEHFGTETREFFSISAGLVYRIGKR